MSAIENLQLFAGEPVNMLKRKTNHYQNKIDQLREVGGDRKTKRDRQRQTEIHKEKWRDKENAEEKTYAINMPFEV